MQLDLFNSVREMKKITKPIRLIEFFSGIGSQAASLRNLKANFEHYKTCEWAVNSIRAYNVIHIKDNTDYSKDLTKEQLIEYLDGNISTNYNEPCDVRKQNEKWLRDVYNNCVATHNLMNIMKVHGKDLEIVDTDKYEYILTYSFPCQDLSLAGLRQGMGISQADGGTRSGLLWEVERILSELTDRPQILLMENVPEVMGTGNVEHFNKWLDRLESFGYTNYFKVLNAKDYGIPQNRKRCFMVSLLDNYGYEFPIKQKLKYKLKDFLETNVDERYYLSKKMIDYVLNRTPIGEKEFKSANNIRSVDTDKCAGTLTTKGSNTGTSCRGCDTFIVDNMTQNEIDMQIYKKPSENLKEELCNYLIENGIVKEGDCVNHSYSNSRMEKPTISNEEFNDCSPTLTTRPDTLGVVVNNEESLFTETEAKLFTEDGNIKRYLDSDKIDLFKEGQMATTTYPNGYNHGPRTHNESISLNTIDRPCVKQNLRIRKLTPKEAIRLMGFQDSDYESMKDCGLSDMAIYHCAGDSIVVNVLMAIFGEML